VKIRAQNELFAQRAHRKWIRPKAAPWNVMLAVPLQTRKGSAGFQPAGHGILPWPCVRDAPTKRCAESGRRAMRSTERMPRKKQSFNGEPRSQALRQESVGLSHLRRKSPFSPPPDVSAKIKTRWRVNKKYTRKSDGLLTSEREGKEARYDFFALMEASIMSPTCPLIESRGVILFRSPG